MHYRLFRTIGASVILAVVALAAVAQISGSQDTAAADIGVEDTTTTVGGNDSSTTSTAPEQFTYRIGILSGISTDNFWTFYGREPSVWNSYVLGPTKPALFTTDPARGEIEPELVVGETEPVRQGDRWVVDLDLATDLAWSDGTVVTAHDLVFTFETVRTLSLGGSWQDAFPAAVTSIEATGDHSVEIEFDGRPRLAVWPYGVGMAPVMAKHVWEPKIDGVDAEGLYGLSGADDVGGGPLSLSSVSERRIISHANAGYPQGDGPDTVEYLIFADEASAVEALDRGDIDYILSPKGLTAASSAALEQNPDVELLKNPGNAVRYVGFNLNRPPMADGAFRTALALLVDRAGLSDRTQAGPAAWSMVPEANTAWYAPETAAALSDRFEKPAADRLAAAVTALEESGYEWATPPSVADGELVPGEGLTIDGVAPRPLTILTPGDAYDPQRPDYAAAVAETLAVLGFDARPVETDFDTVVDLAFTPDEDGELKYDMYLLGWTLGNPGLPAFYGALFSTDGEVNNTGYASGAFEEALTRYETAADRDEAFAALWDMERILAVDLPYLPLYTNTITEAYRSDRVRFPSETTLGGVQARLGGIWDVRPAD